METLPQMLRGMAYKTLLWLAAVSLLTVGFGLVTMLVRMVTNG